MFPPDPQRVVEVTDRLREVIDPVQQHAEVKWQIKRVSKGEVLLPDPAGSPAQGFFLRRRQALTLPTFRVDLLGGHLLYVVCFQGLYVL